MLSLALSRHCGYTDTYARWTSFPLLLTFSVQLKFIFKYSEGRSSKMFFLDEEAGARLNSSVIALPSRRQNGKEETFVVKASVLRFEPERLSALVEGRLPRSQCPLTHKRHTVTSQTPCHRPVHPAQATGALLSEVGPLGWAWANPEQT